ncbi:MAG: ribonuclease HIII [Chlamydiae bacterium]|nr:ribonuclease HIII [Chlamydiota bacterium]
MAKSACFTALIDVKLANRLKRDLKELGFELSQPPYTIFSAKKKGVSCALYESGKLTVQGKEMDSFIEFYLEPEILGQFRYSHPEAHLDVKSHIGMDEAGKGDFFGPLCVAAVYAEGPGILQMQKMGVRDSKKIGDDAILKLAYQIRTAFPYTLIRLFPQKYNELYAKFKNLNRMLAWAHTAALSDLSQKTGCKEAVLDQFAFKGVMESFLKQKKLDVDLEQRVRGEEDLVVAAASIVARAGFVEGMKALSEEFGMEIPKGANGRVLEAARQIAARHGKDVLNRAVKTHFKTMQEI